MEMRLARSAPGSERSVERIDAQNRPLVNQFIEKRWLGTLMVVRGRPVDMTALDGLALYDGGQIAGLITFRMLRRVCEIISLDSMHEHTGVGSALLCQALEIARAARCCVVRLSTTNDNTDALRFYQRRGFDILRVRRDAMRLVREMKPNVPLTGFHGIPLRHEIDLEYRL
jgi:GNAT superfamily N-acetyltransferase